MRPICVFDGDCSFCTSAVGFAKRWVRPDASFVAWQRVDLAVLGLTEQACGEALQYRDPDGRWTSGGRAVTALLRDGRRPWSWLGRLAGRPGPGRLLDHGYVLIAANRHRLPGGKPACRNGGDHAA